MEKKKVVKKIIFVVIGIVLVFAAIIIYMAIKDLQQEELLKQEIVNYSNKNLETDNFPVIVKTKGDYAYVEEAVKKYYKDLSDNVKSINSCLKNEKLLTVLAPSSLKNDRPGYASSYEILKDTRDKVNKAIENIGELCDEKTIKGLIDKDKLDDGDYYYDLFLKFMYTKKDKEDLLKTRESMEEVSKSFNEYLDKADEILAFLKVNDNIIEYGNGMVYFNSSAKVEEYNKLVSDLQEIANKMKTMNTKDTKKESKNDAV